MDSTLKMWDILTGRMLFNYKTDKIICTFDVSPDSDLIASCFSGSREIYVWHNLVN
jgi:hypothetical protein